TNASPTTPSRSRAGSSSRRRANCPKRTNWHRAEAAALLGPQDDLSARVPLLQRAIRAAHFGERDDLGDRHLQLSGGDEAGEFAERVRARAVGVARGLDAEAVDGREVGDGVDSLRGDAQF